MPAPKQSSRSIVPFGNYLLDELIAEGGMARVFRARLRGVGGFEKPLVVKQVRPELASDPRFVEMFVEEAKTVVKLSHPHIVPVYELGVVDGTYFLAMELVEGATLSAILHQGPLPPALVARIASQVCDALDHAHTRFDLVHRDVTPRNILLDEGGHARLVDFGIATPAQGETGEVFGSPGYMSPEQLRGESIDGRSDLFTLGAVLYQCLTGKAAFLRKDREASRAAVLDEEGPELDDTFPSALRDLIHEMIARDLEQRPSSAAEVGGRMRKWSASEFAEDTGHELGERAMSAMKPLETGDAGPVTVTSRKQDVQTLATSAILEDAREEEPDSEPMGTQPMTERITSRKRTDETPRTVAVAKRGEAIEEGQVEAVDVASPRNRMAAVVLIVAASLGAWLFLRPTGPDPDTRPQRIVEPSPPTMEVIEMVQEPVAMVEMEEPAMMAEMETMVVANAPRPSTIEVNAQPFAHVTLDRSFVGNTPIRRYRTTPGRHTLILNNDDLGQVRVPLDLAPGQNVRVIANFFQDPPSYRVLRR